MSNCVEGRMFECLGVRREPEQMMRQWNSRMSTGQLSQRGRREDEESVPDLDPLNDKNLPGINMTQRYIQQEETENQE